ncbi:MAG: hypothetical protein J5858_17565 [Lentisphaeria bacterium]|nr:hypothetical protein [Lentisphaeria bacterium]
MIVPAILHARKGRDLESEKIVYFDSSRRKRGTGDFSAHPPVRHPDAIRFRRHLSGKTKILQKRFFKTARPHAEKGLLKPPFCIFMGFLWFFSISCDLQSQEKTVYYLVIILNFSIFYRE